jgi:Domain of unknown function (DUF4412)
MVTSFMVPFALAALQAAASPTPKPRATAQPVQVYALTVQVEATAPALKAGEKAAPEAAAMLGALKNASKLESRFLLTTDTSRQEIVSTDFPLPAGTLVYHKAGEKPYLIADPKTRTYVVLDAETLLNALEGGAGIENNQYQVKVEHTGEKKTIAGYECRKSVARVTYVSSIPLENDRVLVQQKNDVVVWHTSQLVSSAGMDHLFFKFRRDKTGEAQKVLGGEIGFPMEVSFTVTQATPGPKAATPQPGSFHMIVTEAKGDKVDPAVLQLPPAGYQKVDKNPFAAP